MRLNIFNVYQIDVLRLRRANYSQAPRALSRVSLSLFSLFFLFLKSKILPGGINEPIYQAICLISMKF